eukprot:2589254-Prymnesium_polylepis.3
MPRMRCCYMVGSYAWEGRRKSPAAGIVRRRLARPCVKAREKAFWTIEHCPVPTLDYSVCLSYATCGARAPAVR